MRRLATLVLGVLLVGLGLRVLLPTIHRSPSFKTFPDERLGSVSFAVSCAPRVQVPFNRGVALLHDFWYDEARVEFGDIAKSDPTCAMAHWGIAMSVFRQIWERPDEATFAWGRREMQKAQSLGAKTPRESRYIEVLNEFFRTDVRDYQTRINAYAAALGRLHSEYPEDVDAAAFYALALLAAAPPDDTSLTAQHAAMRVLEPLFSARSDHPGVVHYIIHACDNPSMARDGLPAARHYGAIAVSAPHAVHMPGHIFARLGMWAADIDSNLASVAAAHAAEARHQSGAMEQFHADDFLLYAYLQSGRDVEAGALIDNTENLLNHFESMPDMAAFMTGMLPLYRTKFPVFFALETRDWRAAARLAPIKNAPPEVRALTYWAHAIAAGHLHSAEQARDELVALDSAYAELRHGQHAFLADSTDAHIRRAEVSAWVSFAGGQVDAAAQQMRGAADLQDQVGQGEVDIPAREMLADLLLESGQPSAALTEYKRSLELSPNRFNGLYHAGQAAEETGDPTQAKEYYTALLASTDNGRQSRRPELAHAKSFLGTPLGAASKHRVIDEQNDDGADHGHQHAVEIHAGNTGHAELIEQPAANECTDDS